jgi:hypothetical protein
MDDSSNTNQTTPPTTDLAFNPDVFNKWLDTEEGKKVLGPRLDSHVSKAISTWKQNNLTKEVESEIGRRYPDQTPEARQIAQLRAEMESFKGAAEREKRRTLAIQEASQRNLPTSLVDYFVGDSEEATRANIISLELEFKAALDKAVTDRIKGTQGTKVADTGNSVGMTREKLMSMAPMERLKFATEHPKIYSSLVG